MSGQHFLPIYSIGKMLYEVEKLIFVEEWSKKWHNILQFESFENIQVEVR